MIPLHKRASSFLALGWLLLQLGTVVHAAELEGTEETPLTSSINGQVSGAVDASGLSVILETEACRWKAHWMLSQFSFEALRRRICGQTFGIWLRPALPKCRACRR